MDINYIAVDVLMSDEWQTRTRGKKYAEYEIYLSCADNGTGIDFTTGQPLKSFDDWLNS